MGKRIDISPEAVKRLALTVDQFTVEAGDAGYGYPMRIETAARIRDTLRALADHVRSADEITALRARLDAVELGEAESEGNLRHALHQLREMKARAERAEAALATARQLVTHATTELAQSAQDMSAMRAERALHRAIRALADEAPE
ncbi:MAG: hypothetical protein R3197_00255 [Paracoccaceae bacterium]|nr:hypothetical protein [Paracoccaceae bacterium]